jgi:hypothetical protein
MRGQRELSATEFLKRLNHVAFSQWAGYTSAKPRGFRTGRLSMVDPSIGMVMWRCLLTLNDLDTAVGRGWAAAEIPAPRLWAQETAIIS